MLRYSEERLNTEQAVSALYPRVRRELDARKRLYEKVVRKIDPSDLMSESDEEIKIPMERYISIIATGYFGGIPPKYKVHAFNKEKSDINKEVFDNPGNDEKALKEIEQIITHITDYNDEEAHHLKMVWDFLTKRACYELYYKNKYNEYVYTNVDALEAVAIWDYSMPKNLIGLYRVIETTLANGEYQIMIELTTKKGKFFYLDTLEKRKLFSNKEAYKAKFKNEPLFKIDEKKTQPPKWDDDVPFTAIEQEDGIAIYEPIISINSAYEQITQNNRDTHKYNNEAILSVMGYIPENPPVIQDEEGKWIANPARTLEDELVLQSKVRYLQEGGKLEWITKNINDSAIENHKKTLMDLICLCSFVPNMTDLGFTQADNNSALEKKFFSLQQLVSTFKGEFKKGYTRRWEILLNKINKDKMNKHYDFRDIEVVLNVNLPTDKASETSRALSLRDVLSNETIINMLPDDLDAQNEIAKKKEESEDNLEKNQEVIKKFNNKTKEVKEKKYEKNNTKNIELHFADNNAKKEKKESDKDGNI